MPLSRMLRTGVVRKTYAMHILVSACWITNLPPAGGAAQAKTRSVCPGLFPLVCWSLGLEVEPGFLSASHSPGP